MPDPDDWADTPDYHDGEQLDPEGPSADELDAQDGGDAGWTCAQCGLELHETAELCPACGHWRTAEEGTGRGPLFVGLALAAVAMVLGWLWVRG